ncbi:hypothetical protein V7S43_004817 [Phytophthora oleae]|uniref:Uncharacterized protein n=1 Tax=Phytophthora oleae TaxID=2107226 RepID=A0ABD3FU97_9STRA
MVFEPSAKRFRCAPDAELLAIENDRVLKVLEPALHRLLKLTPASADGRNSQVYTAPRPAPVLTLQLFPRSELRLINDTGRAEALGAFSVLIEHSRRLRDYPEARRAFWLDVLHSRMPQGSTSQVPEAALREPEFPLFAVEFRDCSLYYRIVPPPFVLPEDAVVEFFTTPPVMPTPTQTQVHFQPRPDVNGPDTLAIELSFGDCRLTSVEAVAAVERVLDRVFAHPTRQFAVSALDMGNNRMAPTELAAVAKIAHKCRYEYQVTELRLGGIVPHIVASHYHDYHCPDTTPCEFLGIMRAVYGVDQSPVLSASNTRNTTEMVKDVLIRAPTLRSVSLKGNYVCPVYYAALFSALRYDSPVHEDFSHYIVNDRNGLDEKTLCGIWYAFGLFYPRPKRFRKLLGLRNVGYLAH